MYFLNLKELKIEEGNTSNIIFLSNDKVSDEMNLSMLDQVSLDAVKELMKSVKKDNQEKIYFKLLLSNQVAEETFVSFVNLFIANFCSEIGCKEKRNREWRLNVPKQFYNINANFTQIKRMVNYNTIIDNFNFEIENGNIKFILVDEVK